MRDLNDSDKAKIEAINAHGPDARRVIQLEEMFQESRIARATQAAIWRMDERMYYQEFKPSGGPETQLKIYMPLSVIRSEMGIISDYMVNADIVEDDPDDKIFADMVQHRKTKLDKSSQFADTQLEMVEKSLKYGNGIQLVAPQMIDGKFQGIQMDILDNFTWFPDPNATSMDVSRDSRYHIIAVPMPTGKVAAYFKALGSGAKITADGNVDEYRAFREALTTDGISDRAGYTLLKMAWHWDDEDNPQELPKGRLSVWACNQLAYSVPVTYQRLHMLKNYGDKQKLYGLSQTRLILGLNIALNDGMSGIIDNIRKTGNPPATISEALYARMETTLAGAGEAIPVKQGERYEYVTFPATTSSHLDALNEVMALVDYVTGIRDVLQGKRPAGVTSGIAIRELQEAAIVAVRLKLKRPISPLIEQIVQHQVEIIKEFDRDIKNIRVRAGGATQWVKFDPQNRYARNESGEMAPVPEDQDGGKMLYQSQLEVAAVAAPAMPVGRISTEQIWTERLEKGLATKHQWVMGSTVEDKEAYWKELSTADQAAALAQEVLELEKAREQFQGYIIRSMKLPVGTYEQSMVEQDAARVLSEFPAILKSIEFQQLPPIVQGRLVMVFAPGETTEGEVNEPATAGAEAPAGGADATGIPAEPIV